MNKHVLSWLPITAALAGALACTSKSSNNGNDSTDTSTSDGGTANNGGTANTGGSTAGGGGGSGGSDAGSGGSAGSTATATTMTTGSLGGNAGAAGENSGGGAAGAAGADDGDSGGTDATGGSGGTTNEPPSDPCEGSTVEPNDEHDNPTPYAIGTAFDACLQSIDDVDVYEFSVPDDQRGGVAVVNLTEVGPNADTELELWAAADDGEFYSTGTNTEGASMYFNFNAAPGAMFRLVVTNYLDVASPNPYRLTINYQQVPDEYEPNQVRNQAVPIEVGEDVEAYLFAGWANSTGVPGEDWYDWYSIELEAGATSFLVDVLASDIDHEIVLYNPIGAQIATEGTNTEGSSIILEYEVPEAGKYFVRVNPYIPPGTQDDSLDIPEYASTPYTLTVTQ